MLMIVTVTSVTLTSLVIADNYFNVFDIQHIIYLVRRALAFSTDITNAKASLEAAMLVCFSVSWPFKIRKLLTVKKSVGLSHGFLVMIITGYSCGIMAKVLPFYANDSVNYCLVSLYAVNATMVTSVLVLSIRYRIANQTAHCESIA